LGIELYPEQSELVISSSSSISLFPALSGRSEIDLRKEFKRMLYGYGPEIPKGQAGLLRRMRLDDDNDKIRCDCVDELTHEPDKEYFCPRCAGEGYLWDEEPIVYYKVLTSSDQGLARKNKMYPAGVLNVEYTYFYVEHFVNPNRYDKIIEVQKDLEGDPDSPLSLIGVYKIATAQAFRSDRGRVEYWRLACNEESVKRSWR
jgi:hypothetical protein